MKLEDMVNEIHQLQEEKYCMIPLYEVPRIVKFVETELEWRLPGAGGGKGRLLVFDWYRASVGKDENILEMDRGGGCTTVCMYLRPLNYVPKNS